MAFKFLSVDAFTALNEKATRHDKIVQAINEARADGYDKELTAEEAVEMLLQPHENTQATEEIVSLQTQLATSEDKVVELQASIDSLTLKNQEIQTALDAKPGAETATAAPAGAEAGATELSLVEFAKENKGDLMAIAARLQTEGII